MGMPASIVFEIVRARFFLLHCARVVSLLLHGAAHISNVDLLLSLQNPSLIP
jgi:predicted metallopeptidase